MFLSADGAVQDEEIGDLPQLPYPVGPNQYTPVTLLPMAPPLYAAQVTCQLLTPKSDNLCWYSDFRSLGQNIPATLFWVLSWDLTYYHSSSSKDQFFCVNKLNHHLSWFTNFCSILFCMIIDVQRFSPVKSCSVQKHCTCLWPFSLLWMQVLVAGGSSDYCPNSKSQANNQSYLIDVSFYLWLLSLGRNHRKIILFLTFKPWLRFAKY